MPGKESCHERASPDRAGHAIQNQKKEEDAGDVQQNVCQVMPGWLQAVKLAIQHVRKPGQWMPVAGMEPKCPDQAVAGQASLNVRILRHIFLVIVGEEVMTKRGQVKRQSDQAQGQADQAFNWQVANVCFHADVMMENQPVNSIANSFPCGGISLSPHCPKSFNNTLQLVTANSAYFCLSTSALCQISMLQTSCPYTE
jgi:hypothetical protein